MEAVKDFTFLASKITADGDSCQEIKRLLLLGRKAMTNLGSILKSRDITLPTQVRLVKAMVFPVFMYGWMWELDHKEGWVLKNWCFWTVVLEKAHKSPWTTRRSNQSTLKEINPKYLLEALMLKPELQYFDHLMLGKIEGRREKGTTEDEMVGWHHWLNGHEFEQALGDGEGQESLESMEAAVLGITKSWTQLSNWTATVVGVQYYIVKIFKDYIPLPIKHWLYAHVVQYILIAYFRLNVLYLLIPCPYIAPPCFPLSHWEPLVCSLYLWVSFFFVIFTTMWPSNHIPGYISERNKNTNLKCYMHPSAHSNSIHSSQDMETT